jgi:ammonium transporter Rh
MIIHTFGAYYGLVATWFFQPTKAIAEKEKTKFTYYSNIIAMIGTLFLYMYWPSFNAALGTMGSDQQRAIINTLLANSTSVISACLISRITKGFKLDMIILVNATLAGGAAMGASGNLINYPFCAMIVGFVAGLVAALGYAYMNDFLKKYLKLHDT